MRTLIASAGMLVLLSGIGCVTWANGGRLIRGRALRCKGFGTVGIRCVVWLGHVAHDMPTGP